MDNEPEVVARGPSEKYNSFFEVTGKIFFSATRRDTLADSEVIVA